MDACDAIVIGGNLDGLTAAAVLAGAGLKPVVLERGAVLGGVFRQVELQPGVAAPLLRHDIEAFPASLAAELGLSRFGLAFADMAGSASLGPEGPVVLPGDPIAARAQLEARSRQDAAALAPFLAALARLSRRLAPALAQSPLRVHDRLLPVLRAVATDAAARELLAALALPARAGLARHFKDPQLVDHLALEALAGTGQGLDEPGGFGLLALRAAAGRAAGRARVPIGGAAALIEALAAAIRAGGGEIRTGVDVISILLRGRRVQGAALTAGGGLTAPIVISALDAKRTYLSLVDTSRVPAAVIERVRRFRMQGTFAKLLLVLKGPPAFEGVPQGLLGGALQLRPPADLLGLAHRPRKGLPPHPWLDLRLTAQGGSAPQGRRTHVLSIVVQGLDPDPEGGTWTAERREGLKEHVLAALAPHAPALSGLVTAARVVTAGDIESEDGLSGGDWLAGALIPSQLWWNRPVPALAGYQGPVQGLYLCGDSTHPGPVAPGRSGANAARIALARQGRRPA